MSDSELGRFLRSRRESVTPADVGLPAGSRRRTPGLRRSELAMLAGISVEYLARLEQGRDRHPSPEILAALADALRLSTEARGELMHVMKLTMGSRKLCLGTVRPPDREVRPTLRALLDQLEPAPAVLLNRLGEVVARTGGYERLFGPLGLLEPPAPSLPRFMFTDPRARDAYPEWERVADDLIARIRIDSLPDDPDLIALVDELTLLAGAGFTERWKQPLRTPEHTGVRRLTHPGAGELRLADETLELPEGDGFRLVVHLPADEPTAAALDALAGRRPGALRAVAG
ncbi:helix-turn-helix domain-containing protein [Streptomyces sp. NBC_01716]|uniref:helix-turn-helix domain-containing protein n=1 Tax=Streptomyces sp. NBC_01716 TaxID=2975917 RepID=UPI002E3117F6|nr:helix-turn-helix transcriptional regulator [Streptomyces sp. NBC_01716]